MNEIENVVRTLCDRENILLMTHAYMLWLSMTGCIGVVFIKPLERMEGYVKQVGFKSFKGIAVMCLYGILCMGIFAVGTYIAVHLWRTESLQSFVNESIQRLMNS